jgi:hypothetical protein
VRADFLAIVLAALTTPACAQSLQLIGYSGYLGEWGLTATLTENASSRKEYTGPLTLKHVGICTQDGPEERAGVFPGNSSVPSISAGPQAETTI